MSRKFFIKDTDYATEDTAGVVKVGSGLKVDNGILSADNGGTSGSCIVCSPTQPTDLKTGLWIKTDSDRDIKITEEKNFIDKDRINTMSATLSVEIKKSSACVINGKAYIFGGLGPSSYCNQIQCYDPETNIRTTMSTTLGNPIATSACAINGKAYIFGGTSNADSETHMSYLTAQILCYDPETDTKTVVSRLNYGINLTSACAINGKAYIFGGIAYDGNSSTCRNYIQCYDPETNTRTTMSATLYVSLCGASSCIINGKAYIFGGGTSQGGSYFSYIQGYDPETDTLTKMSAVLKKGNYLSSACTINGKAYVFGGDSSCIQCYDPETDTLTEMPTNFSLYYQGTSACAINGKAYIFGGSKGGSNYCNYILCYDATWICKNSTYTNSISIIYTSGESTNLVALSNDSNSSGQSIYEYKSVNEVLDINIDNIVVPLKYHKIENYKTVN